MAQMRPQDFPPMSPHATSSNQASAQAMKPANGATSGSKIPRYTLLGWRHSRAQRVAALITLLAGAGLAYLYVWYLRSSDVSPDSVYGYGFAITGTILLFAVGIGYVVRKRWRRHWSGRLHTVLAWHMMGALLGLALILMHTSGNFNPRSGTYALYGLIALVVSGVIGRALDRIGPLLAARAALRVLSARGEERLDDLELQLVAMLRSEARGGRREKTRPRVVSRVLGIPWDVGYYDLDPDVGAIPSLVGRGKGGPAGAASAADPDRFGGHGQSPQQVQREVRAIQAAMSREQFYIQLVRTWRRLHTLISLVFLGLLIWHLAYAGTLLMNAR